MAQKARNAVARDLHSPKYAIRIVTKAKGKGSYRRTEKHRLEARSGASSFSGLFLQMRRKLDTNPLIANVGDRIVLLLPVRRRF